MSSSLITVLPVLLILALLVTVIGFKRVVYFLNIGYAFSIVAIIAASVIIFWKNSNLLMLLQSAAIVFWGLRLGIFVTKRELSSGYKKERERIDKEYSNVTLPIQFLIWVSVSVLYLMMVSPGLFSLEAPSQSGAVSMIFQIAGLLAMTGGLALEGAADRQKSAFKAKNPHTFCTEGLYRRVRCPNYLGEITFWTGNWIMGIGFYKSAVEWIISLIGLACIIFIMLSSTKRLERTQLSRYGSLPEYQRYCQTVPILFPCIPLYSLQKSRLIV